MNSWQDELMQIEKNNLQILFLSKGKYYHSIEEIPETEELIGCLKPFKTKKGELKYKLSFKSVKTIKNLI